MKQSMKRRDFVKTAGTAAAGALLAGSLPASVRTNARRRYAIVGIGHRATGM